MARKTPTPLTITYWTIIIAGLAALREHGLGEAVDASCRDCVKRAYELAGED